MPRIIAARIGHVAALLTIVFSVLSVALPIAAARADAPDRAGASGVIMQLGNGTLAILNETQPASSDRYGRFHALIAGTFDLPHIAQVVAGRFWLAASEAERLRFTAAFGDYVTGMYAARFARYTRQTFAVTGQRGEADGTATVSSSVIEPNATPGERVDWRIAATAAGYRITDVSISGVSVARTKRDEFRSIMERNGGRIVALTEALEANHGAQTRSIARRN